MKNNEYWEKRIVEEELEAVKEQEEAEGPEWDKVPTKGSEVDEE